MYNLENLENEFYCICGEFLPEDAINEYCDICNQLEKTCLKCDRIFLTCHLNRGLCWDCINDEESNKQETLKCNFCGKYSSTLICWTCEQSNKQENLQHITLPLTKIEVDFPKKTENPRINREQDKIDCPKKAEIYLNTSLKKEKKTTGNTSDYLKRKHDTKIMIYYNSNVNTKKSDW